MYPREENELSVDTEENAFDTNINDYDDEPQELDFSEHRWKEDY